MAMVSDRRRGIPRHPFRSVTIVLSVVFVLAGMAVALPPASVFASPPATAGSASVPIPLGKACQWAYPGQSNGAYSGTAYSIACLGENGQVLGGFGGPHSLTAWCANSGHTDGRHLPDATLLKGTWVCAA